ncbi:DUF1840 domain-containing protein [Sulfuricystis multivorans]|uniref:DUF1840 domain-containing protein n=1 Tax=Sulfuricystis multivorans TaxID=2211108 RepID=UPI000F81E2A2|nr:DUF1840 domain-containing protein [Sulfuricystis multivorans]
MIVTFKSQASADVIYFGDVAQRLMELMGKEPAERGIVTVEELPEAIARLKAAIDADREAHRQLVQADEPGSESLPEGGTRPRVSLTQRALPLLAMLEESLAAGKPVVWGI